MANYSIMDQRNNMTPQFPIRQFNGLLLGFFLSLVFWAGWIGYREEIPSMMIVLQVIIGISYVSFMMLASRQRMLTLLFFALGYFVLFTYTIQQFSISYWEGIFPPGDGDGVFYDHIAQKYMYSDIRTLFSEYLRHREIGDWGFILTVYGSYHFFSDPSLGRFFLAYMLNPICIILASYYLYRSLRLVTTNYRLAKWVTSSFAFFPYFFLVSAVGRKENVFVFLISACLFFCVRHMKQRRTKDLYVAIITATLMLLFRPPVAAIFLITIILSLYITPQRVRPLFFWGGMGLVIFPFIAGHLIEGIFGISIDHVLAVTEARNRGIGQSNETISWFVQLLSGLLGPFPNFTRSGIYGIFNSIGLLFKCFIPFYIYRVIPVIMRQQVYYMIPVLLCLFMGIAMLVISGVALDIRYHITFFPPLLLLLAYSLAQKNSIPKTFGLYLSLIIVIIVQYNLR